jgi:hypothetical protein
MDWIDVKKEAPPKNGTKILGARWNKSLEYWEISVIQFREGTFLVVPSKDYRLSFIPTHWKWIEENGLHR